MVCIELKHHSTAKAVKQFFSLVEQIQISQMVCNKLKHYSKSCKTVFFVIAEAKLKWEVTKKKRCWFKFTQVYHNIIGLTWLMPYIYFTQEAKQQQQQQKTQEAK